MKIADFKNKKVLIMGLGLHGGGISVANFFDSVGASVTITDTKNKGQLKESLAQLKGKPILVLGKHRESDFLKADLIIKNPAVPTSSPYLEIAREKEIPIKNDVEIFFHLVNAEIIAVTGTKGKSSTAKIISEVLEKKYSVVLAGNIGVSPLEYIDDIKRNTKVVLELSSFILEDLTKSPHVAIITNLFPDHLNRYKSFSQYVGAKENIYKYQSKDDVLIVNREIANIKPPGRLILSDGSSKNIARIVGKLYSVHPKDIEEAILEYEGISHRQEFVLEKNGVKYYNDTAATNPTSVSFALDKFKNQGIVLIAGGEDKNLSYRSLAKHIGRRAKELILLPGGASELIKRDLKKFDYKEAKKMHEAVKIASRLAKKGDIVILSPGAASFNLFLNEFDRGEQFKKAVFNLK